MAAINLVSYTGLRTLYGDYTGYRDSGHLDHGSNEMNNHYLDLCSNADWIFLEKTDYTSLTTVADQQDYTLPADYDKMKMVSVEVGDYRYVCEAVDDAKTWEMLNQSKSWSSSFPSHYTVVGNTLKIWPTPSASSDEIRIVYRRKPKRLINADYTTGSISAATNGSTTITGSGTTWTDKMIGSYIVITDSFDDNTGDGRPYEITAVNSTTELVIGQEYEGPSIAAGTAAYTIGQVPLIPQEYAHLLAYWAAFQYWSSQDNGQSRAVRFAEMYNARVEKMQADQVSKTTQVDVEPLTDFEFKNPNLYLRF